MAKARPEESGLKVKEKKEKKEKKVSEDKVKKSSKHKDKKGKKEKKEKKPKNEADLEAVLDAEAESRDDVSEKAEVEDASEQAVEAIEATGTIEGPSHVHDGTEEPEPKKAARKSKKEKASKRVADNEDDIETEHKKKKKKTDKSDKKAKTKAARAEDEETTAPPETAEDEKDEAAAQVDAAPETKAPKADEVTEAELGDSLGFVIDVNPTKANLPAPAPRIQAEPPKPESKDVGPTGNRKERRQLVLLNRQREIIQKRLGVEVGSTEPNEQVDEQLAHWQAERDVIAQRQDAAKEARKQKRLKLFQNKSGKTLTGKKLRNRKKQLKKEKKRADGETKAPKAAVSA